MVCLFLFLACAKQVLNRYLYAGTGAVYSFDPVGSYEREACRAAGAAQSLVQPLLDNQVSMSVKISLDVANYLVLRTLTDLSPTIRRASRR
jgi:20S proteasome alpha/beta subunit